MQTISLTEDHQLLNDPSQLEVNLTVDIHESPRRNKKVVQVALESMVLTNAGRFVDPQYMKNNGEVSFSGASMTLNLCNMHDNVKMVGLVVKCIEGDLGDINSMSMTIRDTFNQICYNLDDNDCNYMDIIKSEIGYMVALLYRPDNYRPTEWRIVPISRSISVFNNRDVLFETVPVLQDLFATTRGVPVCGLLKGEFFDLASTSGNIRLASGWNIKKDQLTSKLVNIGIGLYDENGVKYSKYPTTISSAIEGSYLEDAIQVHHSYKELEQATSPRRQKFEDGEHETVDIDLNKLPEAVHSLIICIAANTEKNIKNLKNVSNLRARLVDLSTMEEICKLNLTETERDQVGTILACRIYRTDGKWRIKSISQSYEEGLDMVFNEFLKKKVIVTSVIPNASAAFDINIPEARDLTGKDWNGLSDPYVKLYVNGTKSRSAVHKKTLNPKWDFFHHFKSFEHLDKISHPDPITVEIQLWDKDKYKADDFLGQTTFQIPLDGNDREQDEWILLDKRPDIDDEVSGHVRVIYKLQYSSRVENIAVPALGVDPRFPDRLLFEL